ncbi:Metallo-beta-lactamase superfamily protein [compost metagenome]
MIRPLHPRHALLAALALALPLTTALAAPVAKQQTQVPGYYRMAVGDLEITALYDGYVDLGTNLLKGASAEDIQGLLARMFIESSKGVQTAVNAYLVNTGKHLVLVDSGSSKCFGPTLGGILGNLKAAGYQPEQVDSVLLTHLHPDHACGLLDANGKPAFANATVFVSQDEAGYWLNPDVAAKAPADSKQFFDMAQNAVAPYKAAGKLKTFAAGDALVEGVSAAPSPGHTPGHSGYLFSSKGQNLLVWGDVMHSHATQFANPEIAIEFDVDSPRAIASRKQVFADAARDKLWVAGAHLPFPGLGHVRSEGKGYAWVPAEYGPIRNDR